jgi:multidrug efflux pump
MKTYPCRPADGQGYPRRLQRGAPSVRVRVDRQKAALFGLSTDTIGFALKTAYNGLDVSSYREANDDYDITVQLAESDRKVMDVLHELIIPAPSGQLVPLSTLATVILPGPSAISTGSTTSGW